jgi:phosphinothricin acetyltransferase
MKVEIRQAKVEDVNSILEIVNYEILNSTVLYDYKERTFEHQLKWFEKKQADKMPVIVAENKDGVIGFGTFGIFRPWDAYQFSVEHSIYVNKNSRGIGIGKKIIIKIN